MAKKKVTKKEERACLEYLRKVCEKSCRGLGSTLRIYPDGRVDTPGINYETTRMQVVAWNDDCIVIKVPGRTCWDGNYMPRRYVSPMLLVFRVLSVDDNTVHVEPLIDIPLGRKKKEV